MFSSKKATSQKTIPLAMIAVAAAVLALTWLGVDSAEARGRSIPLTKNEITLPAAPDGAGNVPLQSQVEWQPLGSKVRVKLFLFQCSPVYKTWGSPIASTTQLLPGKAPGAVVDWGDADPTLKYRHLVQIYSVKGKDGSSANRQLASEFSLATQGIGPCGN